MSEKKIRLKDKDGNILYPEIANSSVSTDKIADKAVTEEKLSFIPLVSKENLVSVKENGLYIIDSNRNIGTKIDGTGTEQGQAFIVSGADYSSKNLGKVTIMGIYNPNIVDITGISLSGVDSIEKGSTKSVTYTATLTPSNTTQKTLIFESNDSSKVSFDNINEGTATISDSASGTYTISCYSIFNSNIKATKTLKINNPIISVTGIQLSFVDTVNSMKIPYVKIIPSDANNKNWNIESSDSSIAEVDGSNPIRLHTNFEGTKEVTITVYSEENPNIKDSQTITVVGTGNNTSGSGQGYSGEGSSLPKLIMYADKYTAKSGESITITVKAISTGYIYNDVSISESQGRLLFYSEPKGFDGSFMIWTYKTSATVSRSETYAVTASLKNYTKADLKLIINP